MASLGNGMTKPVAIARDSTRILLRVWVGDDSAGDEGRVVIPERNHIGPRLAVLSILAQPYWDEEGEDITVTATEQGWLDEHREQITTRGAK